MPQRVGSVRRQGLEGTRLVLRRPGVPRRQPLVEHVHVFGAGGSPAEASVEGNHRDHNDNAVGESGRAGRRAAGRARRRVPQGLEPVRRERLEGPRHVLRGSAVPPRQRLVECLCPRRVPGSAGVLLLGARAAPHAARGAGARAGQEHAQQEGAGSRGAQPLLGWREGRRALMLLRSDQLAAYRACS